VEEQRVFCRSPEVVAQNLLRALLATACLMAAFAGTQAWAQPHCTGAEAQAATAHAHPTAASYTDLGKWYSSHDQSKCAAEAFRAALRLDPESPAALDGLSRALMENGDSASVVVLLAKVRLDEALALDLGIALMKQGRYDEAAKLLTRALQEFPASQALTNALGDLYILEGDFDQALQVAEKEFQTRPQDVHVQRFYLRMLVATNHSAKAIPLAHKLLATAPNDADLLCLAGTMERSSGDYSTAREQLEKSVAIDPRRPECHYNLGLAFANLGDYARGKEELEKALVLGDTDPDIHFQLAMDLRHLGEVNQAKAQLKIYEEARQANDNRKLATTRSTEASEALAAGDTSKAVALYREACDAQPQDARLAYRLAIALDRTGDLNAERAALERAVGIDPRYALAQAQLGHVESQLGNTSAAEDSFRQALRVAPEYTQCWVGLAATLAAESRLPEAREAVATALKLEPQNANAIELSRNLGAAANQPRP
jgi:tetratricopeptide (TPR) repeat protein